MDQALFEVDIQNRPAEDGVLLPGGERVGDDARGLDLVEFLVAPNPGEGLNPWSRSPLVGGRPPA